MGDDAQEDIKPDMTSAQPLWSSDVFNQIGQNPSTFRAQDGWYASLSSSRQTLSRDQSTSFDPVQNHPNQTLTLPMGTQLGPVPTRMTAPLMQMQHHMYERSSWPPGGTLNHGTIPATPRQDFGMPAAAHQGATPGYSHQIMSSRHDVHHSAGGVALERSSYQGGQDPHAHDDSLDASGHEDQTSETTSPLTMLPDDEDDARSADRNVASSSSRLQLPPAAQAVELAPEMKRQAPRSDGGPRRPMNAFLLFSRYRRKEVQLAGGSTITTAQFSAMLGQEWRNLSDDRRKFWQNEAMSVRDQFNRQYPTYRYSRTKKRLRGVDRSRYNTTAGGYAYDADEGSRETYPATGSTMTFPSSQVSSQYPYQQASTSSHHNIAPVPMTFQTPQPTPYNPGMWSTPTSTAGSTPGSAAVSPTASFYTRSMFPQADSERGTASPQHPAAWSERRSSAALLGQLIPTQPSLYASFPRMTSSAAPPPTVPPGMQDTRADEFGGVGQTGNANSRHVQGGWGWTPSTRAPHTSVTTPTGSVGHDAQQPAGYGATSSLLMGSSQDIDRSGSIPRYLSIHALSNTQATQDWRRSLGSFAIPSTEGLPRRNLTYDSASVQADRKPSQMGVDLPYNHVLPEQSTGSTSASADQNSGGQCMQQSFSIPEQAQAGTSMTSALSQGLESAEGNVATVDEDETAQDNLGVISVTASPVEPAAAAPTQERADFLRNTILTTPAFPSQTSGQAPSSFPEDGYARE
ncbi:hypothetical protein OC861_006183 [Tilletia horrida]|nr:hypothetical protein OC845_006055 [Tilletia horrida]KAK0560669.1 hypothetical protein OC861_006183 [Tilletia horrida]